MSEATMSELDRNRRLRDLRRELTDARDRGDVGRERELLREHQELMGQKMMGAGMSAPEGSERAFRRGYLHAVVGIYEHLHNAKGNGLALSGALSWLGRYEDVVTQWREQRPLGVEPPPTPRSVK